MTWPITHKWKGRKPALQNVRDLKIWSATGTKSVFLFTHMDTFHKNKTSCFVHRHHWQKPIAENENHHMVDPDTIMVSYLCVVMLPCRALIEPNGCRNTAVWTEWLHVQQMEHCCSKPFVAKLKNKKKKKGFWILSRYQLSGIDWHEPFKTSMFRVYCLRK